MMDRFREMYDEIQRERGNYAPPRTPGKRSGFKISGKAMKIGLATTLVLFTYAGFRHPVGETEVGAKFNKFTGRCEELTAGTHFFPPFVNDLYKLDARNESTTMNDGQEGDRKFDDRLPFKTRDGNEIKLNLTVPYNVQATRACEIVMNVGRSNEEIREKIVRPYTRSIPRDHFGALSSEDFANTAERNKMADSAGKDLGAVLERYGLYVKNVNTNKYEFSNSEYRTLVEQMKIAESALPGVQASIPAQDERNRTLLNEAEEYKKKTIATADGALNQAKVQADGYFQSKSAEAKGILAKGQNRATAIRKERESMMSSGGTTKIQMQIAECLKDKPIIQVPYCGSSGNGQLTVFDVNKFMSQYAVAQQKAAQEGQQ